MKKLLLMFGLGAMLLTSCDQDITNEIYLPNGNGVNVSDSTSMRKLKVFTNLETMAPPTTRAVDNRWEANDSIGIYTEGALDNTKFVRKGSTNEFVTDRDIYFPDINEHTFYAYYPYTSKVSNDLVSFEMPKLATQAGQKANDFLFATAKAYGNDPQVNFTFHHKMARVILKIYTSPEYGFTENEFSKAYLTLINFNGSGTFNTKTGEIRKGAEMASKDFDGVSKSGYLEFTLYVPEQIMPDLYVTISNTDESFYFATSGNWVAGHSYTYSLKPMRSSLEVLSTTITNWTVEPEQTFTGS